MSSHIDQPAEPAGADEPLDVLEAVNALGAVWAPETGPGEAPGCVMCGGPCTGQHPEFGSPEYFARLDEIHGRSPRSD